MKPTSGSWHRSRIAIPPWYAASAPSGGAFFRSYLRHMQRDFNRVSGALAAILLTAAQDRPELSQELLRQKSRFAMAMLSAHFRLVLHGFGIGTVDVSGMIGSLDALRAALGQLSAVPDAA